MRLTRLSSGGEKLKISGSGVDQLVSGNGASWLTKRQRRCDGAAQCGTIQRRTDGGRGSGRGRHFRFHEDRERKTSTNARRFRTAKRGETRWKGEGHGRNRFDVSFSSKIFFSGLFLAVRCAFMRRYLGRVSWFVRRSILLLFWSRVDMKRERDLSVGKALSLKWR